MHKLESENIQSFIKLMNFMDPKTDFVGNDKATYMWLRV
jgi:hypothetical protein